MNDIEIRARGMRAVLAPGTPLRAGLERILSGRTGALLVLGTSEKVRRISSGGFVLDEPFSPTALRELAKMDGAIILSGHGDRILAAAVQLMPDPTLPTMETGTRHRTAERVAQETGLPVVTVSASMNTIALFLGDRRFQVEAPAAILGRANLALQTLERYRTRLQQLLVRLSALEVQDQVTVHDVAVIGQRLEMVRRLEAETADYVTELGTDGRLIGLQLVEADSGVGHLSALLATDYAPEDIDGFGFHHLAELSDAALVDTALVARAIGFEDSLDDPLVARGYRQLAGIQRLPSSVVERLINHFGGLQGIIGATSAELREVEGVGDHRARLIRDLLAQIAESMYGQPLD
ncbi:DNA integrity scanning diadenylate cyclase DisA [Granulicoccus sp. GXG6511]|uniref:DNA integrity scanning diadenylate cyclase DisA n=1 Tax=Granulicoccus sp. GXG6511 TaxID=3381351 RepID=UPI003D7D95D2